MNLRLLQMLSLAAYLLGHPNTVPASQKSPKPPESFDRNAIHNYLAGYLNAKQLPGLSVAILRNGELALAKGYGRRSLEESEPVTVDTQFAIGSVSKQFACACILLLAEAGKLSPRDKVAKYYPNLTRANDITLLDLMNHVSGYPDYYPLDFVDRRMQREIALDELLHQYAGGKLDFEPGSRYSYSNTGYVLLGRVVEKVSGEPFGEFLSQHILKPLGLNHTLHEPEVTGRQFARGYTTFALSAPESAEPEAKGWIGAAGAMYSTPSDLAKWCLALMTGKVLKPESYALMTQPRQLNDGRISEYGCGLGVKLQSNRRVLSHSGAVSGFAAYVLMIPSTKSAVILACNQDGGLNGLPGQLAALLLKEPGPNAPRSNGPAAADAAKRVFLSLQKGRVNRKELSEEFNHYLTDAKIAGAARRLKSYGAVKQVELLTSSERGGMEVTTAKLTLRQGTLKTLMYRMPDGKIEQFFVYPE